MPIQRGSRPPRFTPALGRAATDGRFLLQHRDDCRRGTAARAALGARSRAPAAGSLGPWTALAHRAVTIRHRGQALADGPLRAPLTSEGTEYPNKEDTVDATLAPDCTPSDRPGREGGPFRCRPGVTLPADFTGDWPAHVTLPKEAGGGLRPPPLPASNCPGHAAPTCESIVGRLDAGRKYAVCVRRRCSSRWTRRTHDGAACGKQQGAVRRRPRVEVDATTRPPCRRELRLASAGWNG